MMLNWERHENVSTGVFAVLDLKVHGLMSFYVDESDGESFPWVLTVGMDNATEVVCTGHLTVWEAMDAADTYANSMLAKMGA